MFSSRLGSLLEQDFPGTALTWSPVGRIVRDLNAPDDQRFNSGVPAMDVEEINDGFVVSMDLPGIAVDDIEVTVDDGALSIKGERKQTDKQVEENRFSRFERHFGSFSRAIQLPKSVDPDRIEASCRNGVLEVKLQKRESLNPRRIEIN